MPVRDKMGEIKEGASSHRPRTAVEKYHFDELAVARDPSHPNHILPPPVPEGGRILDIGCGAGQALIVAYPDRETWGIDPDWQALALGKQWTDRVQFVQAKAEQLPFRSGLYDLVFSRVALPYSNIGRALREIARVTKDGGRVWLTLHPFSMSVRQVKKQNWKGKIFFCYIVLNSTLFHFTGRQFSLFGRNESFQTEDGIRRALKRSGFDNISVTVGKHFLVTAERRATRQE